VTLTHNGFPDGKLQYLRPDFHLLSVCYTDSLGRLNLDLDLLSPPLLCGLGIRTSPLFPPPISKNLQLTLVPGRFVYKLMVPTLLRPPPQFPYNPLL
jgi:hypothetical protein